MIGDFHLSVSMIALIEPYRVISVYDHGMAAIFANAASISLRTTRANLNVHPRTP